MRRYETIVILDPDLGEEGRGQVLEQVKSQIDQFDGRLVKFDEWGNRKLAYKIRKKPRGHYIRIDFCGTNELVNEMERRFKINDAFLKFMTVLLEHEVDLESIEAEIAEEEQKVVEAREKALLAAQEAQAKVAAAAEEKIVTDESSGAAAKNEDPAQDDSKTETTEPVTTEPPATSSESSTPGMEE